MTLSIRFAHLPDAPDVERIEAEADQLLIDRLHATDWPPADAAAERLSLPGFVLFAESDGTPAGFVHVLALDGEAHLEQLSVHPRFGRRGIGRMLVRTAMDEAGRRGHHEITLRTYADVPWNAPFYASCGFIETEPATEALRRLVAVEKRLGLDAYGRRVQMTASLVARPSSAIAAAGAGVI